MKCTVPGANIKVLARAIHALSRIGDELYVEPDVNSLSFRSVNSSRSAYASFTFNRPFFSFYKYEPSRQSQGPSQAETTKCKIAMKSCLPVFKSPVMLDRRVENCIMRFEEDGAKLVFEMRCRHGIIRTHYLPVIECETLQVVYTKDDSNSCLLAHVQVLSDAVHHFHITQEEVTLAVTPQKIVLQSFTDSALNPAKQKHTEVSLDPREFDEYSVTNDTAVTFCHKEFRALLQFAEVTNLPVEACFDVGGRPIVFGVKNDSTFEASFVLSTLAPDSDSQSTPQLQRESNAETGSLQPSDLIPSKADAQPPSKLRPQTPETQTSNIPRQKTNSILDRDTPSLPPPVPVVVQTPVESSGPSPSPRPSPSLLSTSRFSRTKETPNCNTSVRQSQNHHEPKGSQKNMEVPPSRAGTPQESRLSLNGLSLHAMSHESSLSLLVRESDGEDNDTIAGSPEPPRKRMCRFSQFFQRVFDPNSIPGHDVILAEDSEEENS